MKYSQSPTKRDKRANHQRSASARFAFMALVGVGLTWLAQKALSAKLTANLDNQGLRPKPMTGRVIKTLEQFSFISTEGSQYHLSDPSHIIDSIAKERGIKASLYELKDVKIKGVISKVGNYGHMGRFERQIIVTARDED